MTRRCWLVVLLTTACDRPEPPGARSPPISDVACKRAWGEKLGVPFVRLCPADLPGVITTPMWIAAAPIGCTGGEHETVPCPDVVVLGPTAEPGSRSARTVQLIAAAHAHRTCSLRFGGRLASAAERAQALAAADLLVVAVTAAPDNGATGLVTHPIPEWVTPQPCTSPAMVEAACAPTTFPSGASLALPWSRLVQCEAAPVSAAGALRIRPGEACPPPVPDGPPCLLTGERPGAEALRLTCQAAPSPELALAATTEPRAAFRCVVPEATLAGTIH